MNTPMSWSDYKKMSETQLDITEIKKTTDDKNYDTLVSLLTGLCGFIPGAGAAIVETIKNFIPNDREERVIDFIQRIAYLTNEHNDKIHNLENKISFFENLSNNKYLRNLLESGIKCSSEMHDDLLRQSFSTSFYKLAIENSTEEIEKEDKLKLISQLSLPEVLILISLIERFSFGNSDFDKKWGHYISKSYDYRDKYLSSLASKGLIILDSRGEWLESSIKRNHTVTRFGKEIIKLIYDKELFGIIQLGPFPEKELKGLI